MAITTTIAIIGASGKTGYLLAHALVQGHRLLLIDEQPEPLHYLAEELALQHPYAEVEVMDCAFNACWEADIIVLAIPCAAAKEVAQKINKVATNKIVIYQVNPASSEALQTSLPYARLVYVFNQLQPGNSNAAGITEGLELMVQGGHEEAVQTVAALFSRAGFTVNNSCRQSYK